VKYFGLSILIAPDFTMDLSYLSSVLYDSPHYNDFKNNKQNDKREYPVLLNSRFIGLTTYNLVEFTYCKVLNINGISKQILKVIRIRINKN